MDILDWVIELPYAFLPIAEEVIELFNSPIIDIINNYIDNKIEAEWLKEIFTDISNTLFEFFNLDITILEAILGTGLVILIPLTLVKWLKQIIG